MSPANLAGAPGAFWGLHAVRVAKRTKQVPRIDRSTPNEMDPDPALSFATSFFVTPIMLKDLLLQTRSFRRFYEDERLDADVLTAAIDAARLCPSARNAQPLKYRLVTARDECDRLFPTLRWAAYLKDWGGPAEGERPAAYLIQLLDTRIVRDPYCDDGIQALAILLSLAEHGLGGCIIKAFNAKQIQADFRLPDFLEVRTVLALGRPRETVVIEPMSPDGDYRYRFRPTSACLTFSRCAPCWPWDGRERRSSSSRCHPTAITAIGAMPRACTMYRSALSRS